MFPSTKLDNINIDVPYVNNLLIDISSVPNTVEISEARRQVKNKLTAVSVKIPSFLLKYCIREFLYSLRIIFKLILETPTFPDQLKW